ncbi:DNA polymerase delta small subunit Cdc1 [Rhodotorula toruloides]
MPIRLTSSYALPDPSDDSRAPFTTSRDDEEFQKQYANLYWQRLTELRARVLSEAKRRWVEGEGFKGASNRPQHVRRLLEVENGKLCYVVGTVYVDMPLKPNVLEDLARDHHITAPATRRKYHSPSDEIMLEDESGRVRLVGSKVDDAEGTFVTGTIMAALGAEMASGDFEVFEYCFAGMPDQPPLNPTTPEGEWVALASGMEMGTASEVADVRSELLSEWLLGEAGDDEDQDEAVKVTRLILAGNSLAQPDVIASDEPKKKRYGYDSSMYTSKPTETLDAFLCELAPSISIDMMSGEKDPTEPTLPQQPLHPALLPNAAAYEGFTGRTNPFWCDVGGASFLGTSGQTLDDIFKYIDSEDRIGIAQQTLEWSHIAPTCPDTLWCYPFSGKEPFVLKQTPHVYFFGNQTSFGTRLVESDDGKKVRIVLVPRFCETGEVVLVNTATLEVKVQRFELLQ